MAARWLRLTASRRFKLVAIKWRRPRAGVAHREHGGATGRRREAVEVAGHVRQHGGHSSLEKIKEMAVRAIRAELAGASGRGGVRE
jgi:hypothetical protein